MQDQDEKEQEIKELTAQAVAEQASDAANKTYDEGAVSELAESNAAESHEMIEGDVIPAEDAKEEWNEDAQQVDAAIEADANAQQGAGAFEQARSSWANGWGV